MNAAVLLLYYLLTEVCITSPNIYNNIKKNNMILPTLAFVFNRRKTASPRKTAPVELRITYRRRQKYISTGVHLFPKNWKRGTVTNRIDAIEIQTSLDRLMRRARRIVSDMAETGTVDLDQIPVLLQFDGVDSMSFIEYCSKRSVIRYYNKSADSAERYERFMRWFRKWGGIRYFRDINESNIMAMDKELLSTGMKMCSKWNNYHRFLNSFIIDAIADGYLRRNPYRSLHIEKEKNSGALNKYLTSEEFHRLESHSMPTESLERVRDLFVFQTYTCLAYTDLASFDSSRLRIIDGMKVYTGYRGKTKVEFSFVLLSPAEAILSKYDGRLPIISNAKYNDYLKMVAVVAGINKPISSHWARHTGATMLLNDGRLSMDVVARVLGHSSPKITREVYAKLLEETVVDAMRGLEKRMNKNIK